MKRIFLILAALVVGCLSAMAQFAVFDDYDHRSTTGLLDAGYEFVDEGTAFNVNIGFNYEFGTSNCYFGARAGYCHYGYDDYDIKCNYNYVRVPVELGYNSALSHKFGINVYGGVSGLYCVAGKTEMDGDDMDMKPDGIHFEGVVGLRLFLSSFFVGGAYNMPFKKDDEMNGLKKGFSDDAYFSASIGFKF